MKGKNRQLKCIYPKKLVDLDIDQLLMALQVILVEDEESLSEMIKMNLELEGYSVLLFSNGKEAADYFEDNEGFDLIILDVMLPGMGGLELCRHIRLKHQTPILFLSAKGSTSDRIEGLKLGANDYLPKPFDLEELLLRVAILTKSNEVSVQQNFTIGTVKVDFESFEIKDVNGSNSTLSKREIALLKLFIEQDGNVVSRDDILDAVWGKDQFPTSRTIDNYILNFRKIFEKDPKMPQFFHSIRGVGYKFTSKGLKS